MTDPSKAKKKAGAKRPAKKARVRATEADLRACPADGQKYELVNGTIQASPVGARHEGLVTRLVGLIEVYSKPRRAGRVFGSGLGVRMPGGNVRSPDVAFFRADRLPKGGIADGFSEVLPDLVVEVLSPHDRPRQVAGKLGEFVDAGVPLLWVVDPSARTVTVYPSGQSLGGDEVLDAGDAGAGFTCRVSDLFE